MKTRLILLALCGAGLSFAQYAYDYSKSPVISDSTRWSSNGSPTYPSLGVTFSGSSPGGSLISIPTISVESGGNQNDYEVNTTLALNSGGGTYIHFLRASSGTVESGSGSYVSVELVIPSSFSGSASATLNINQSTSGTITQLGSTTITASNGMTLRSVIFGTSLWIFANNLQVWGGTVSSTAGNPGIGGYNMPSGSGLSGVKLGHHDTVAPVQINAHPIPSSVFPNSASLQWEGVLDDSIGIGLFEYYIARNGTAIATSPRAEFADATVAPSTTYTYTLQAVDYHGNVNAGTTVTVTTPPAGAVDPRRVGLYSTGSYWGGGGEQIDTLSGNLHFSVPLLTAQGRNGWTIPVGIVYDSQNWRQDSGVNWQLGNDVGYGFGWKLLIGSITPYYAGFFSGVDHYIYTDSTGTQYRLNQNNGGVWTSSTQSVYVWLDTTVIPNKLHFRNGTFWVMGSTSAGTEQDAGTMYPTIIEDTFGNQIIVTYDTAAGLPYYHGSYPYTSDVYEANTSSRILAIDDVRGYTSRSSSYLYVYGGAPYASYFFTYDHADYAIPHLTSFTNFMQTPEAGTFTYTSGAQEPPFGTDPNYSGATALFLSSLTTASLQPYQFAYDSAGAGELASMISPYGGKISWSYGSFQYIGSRTLREVNARYLAPDALHATNPPWTYGISRPDAANSVTVHSAMTLTDASGIGAKTWTFNTGGGAAWQIGLASRFTQLTAANGNIMQDDYFTWSQDPAGHPYISAKTSIADEGTGNQQSALSTQTLDQYGNVTQSVIYPYNNTSTPLQTYNNTYITSSNYTSSYIFNLLSTSTITMGGTQTTLLTNTYDPPVNLYTTMSGPFGGVVYGGWTSTSTPSGEFNTNSPVPQAYKGVLTGSVTSAKATGMYSYSPYGGPSAVTGTDGTNVTASASSGTNYAAPQSISVQNYNQTVAYNGWLGVTSQTGQNGEQLSMTYDAYGRPSTGTSPYGAVTTYSYGTTAPFTQTQTGPSGVTTTTVDGFGRAVLTARGDTSSVHSYTTTVYAPCACSPLGKQSQASQPWQPGGSASNWTTWTYDGLGRTVSVQQPDGASTTHYAYSGNQTTVTDPAGNGKQFTKDVLGNLTTVVEPDPNNQPSGTLTTSYTYDWMNHVTQVSMTRGSTTQTRTFAYDSGGRLTSATNPENGTVTYSYNADNTLHDKHDAKGQDTIYTYDSLKRVTEIQRYPNGVNHAEDTCARVKYTYDTNPVNSSFSQYSAGRLTTAQYSSPGYGSTNGACSAYNVLMGDQNTDSYVEMYSYHPAGAVTAKNLQLTRQYGYGGGSGSASLEVDYTYDTAGRTATVTYPMTFLNGYSVQPVLTAAYDTMGRPSTLVDRAGDAPGGNWATAQYDFAGRMTSLVYITGMTYPSYASETKTYNVNGQMASASWFSDFGGGVQNGIQYTYSATQNNGQITQATDTISGETISYQYDALKRLTSASSTPISGSTPTAWTQTYQYDGFGNLTAKVLNGTTTPIAVNAATNQLTNAYYDANGNMTSGAGASLSYDEANRLATAQESGGGSEYYGYDPANKRIYRMTVSGQEQFTFYGAKGEKLGLYGVTIPSGCGQYQYGCISGFTPLGTSIWFAGKLILDTGNSVYQDRVGTNRATGARFRPYGDEITSTSNDREKFATYTRDSYTGLDYADQRFYASSYGRFNTPDPSFKNVDLENSGSFNLFAYANGDPVNSNDPTGLLQSICESQPFSPICNNGVIGIGDGESGPTDPVNDDPDQTRVAKKPDNDPCNSQYPKNKTYLDFIQAHKSDAQKLAGSSGISAVDILAVSVVESAFGGSPITLRDNNFFGLHNPDSGPFPGQVGVDPGPPGSHDGVMAVFSAATGYYDSGAAFTNRESGSAGFSNNATAFATYLHNNGYGVGNASYVNELVNVIGNVAARVNCP